MPIPSNVNVGHIVSWVKSVKAALDRAGLRRSDLGAVYTDFQTPMNKAASNINVTISIGTR